MPDFFESTFLDLLAAIATFVNQHPTYKSSNHKIIGCFPATDEIYKAINLFNSNAPIPVFDYSQKLRRIRSEMMSLKRNEKV